MNASEVEPKMVTRGTGVERHNLVRYLLLILGTGYVIVSLYLIFECHGGRTQNIKSGLETTAGSYRKGTTRCLCGYER